MTLSILDPPSMEEMFLANSKMDGSLVTNATGSRVSRINGPSVTAALTVLSIGLDFFPSPIFLVSGSSTRGSMSIGSCGIFTAY